VVASEGERLVTRARALFGVRRAALFWREGATGALRCVATAGEGDAGAWVGQTLAPGVGVAGRAVATGRAASSVDLGSDPRIPVAAWLRERLAAEGLHAVAAAPLRASGEIVGALGILDGGGRRYAPEDLARLAALADEAAPRVAGQAGEAEPR
jgi:GAF domain-containing protein